MRIAYTVHQLGIAECTEGTLIPNDAGILGTMQDPFPIDIGKQAYASILTYKSVIVLQSLPDHSHRPPAVHWSDQPVILFHLSQTKSLQTL